MGRTTSTSLSAGLASLFSLLLSLGASRVGLADFGRFSFAYASALAVAGYGRALLGEVALGSAAVQRAAGTHPSVSGIVVRPFATGLGGGLLLIVLPLTLLGASFLECLAAWLLGASLCSYEVTRVALIVTGRPQVLAGSDVGRVVVVGSTLVLAEVLVGLSLFAVLLVGLVGTCLSQTWLVTSLTRLRTGGVDPPWPTLKEAAVVATELFSQRGVGQLLNAGIIAGLGITAFGTLAIVRLLYAPMTTVQAALATVAVGMGRERWGRGVSISLAVALCTIGYGLLLLGLVAYRPTMLEQLVGTPVAHLSDYLVPIAVFVAGGSASPVASTLLRSGGHAVTSMRVRLCAGAAMLTLPLVAMGRFGTLSSVTWSLALASTFQFAIWTRAMVIRLLAERRGNLQGSERKVLEVDIGVP